MDSSTGTHTLSPNESAAEVIGASPRVVTRPGLLSSRRTSTRERFTRAFSRSVRRRWARRAAIGVVGVSGAMAIGVIVVVLMARQTPAWFQPPANPNDPQVMAMARRVENSIATVLTRIRTPDALAANQPASLSPDRWAIALSAADANAWLSARLPRWMETEYDPPLAWPKEVSAIQVAFENGRIYAGARLTGSGANEEGRVLTATIEPTFDGEGALWTPARTIGIGRMRVPAAMILSAGAGTGPSTSHDEQGAGRHVSSGKPDDLADLPQTRRVLAAFAGRVPTLRNPVLKIGDGRKIKIVAIDAKDGRLIVTFETIAR